MNETIKNLAEAAGLITDLSGQPYPVNFTAEQSLEAYQRFAQLIVERCVTIAEAAPYGYQDYRIQIEGAMRDECVRLIKRDFGLPYE